MHIIETFNRNLIFDTKILLLICIVSQLSIIKTVSAESVSEEDHWFSEKLLDGSWLPTTLQIHGFLSQGFVHTTDNNFFGKSDDGVSTNYRELGINGSWRVIPELQLFLQVVYRDAGATDDHNFRIDYGVADYSFYSTESSLLGVKAGRVPLPHGIYQARDVLSNRPSILLPQSIYFDRNRNSALSADGGYIYGEHRTAFGDFFFDAGAVVNRTDDPDIKFGLTQNLPGKFNGKASWVGRFAYEWQSGRVRTSITYGDYHIKYKSKNTAFQNGKVRFNPLIFSVQYNGENWSITGEYELSRRRFNNFVRLPDSDTKGFGYYIQGTYQLTSWIEGLVRYDSLVSDRNDKDGEKFSASTRGRLPAHSRFAEDWTVGLRFKIVPDLLFSAEFHHINGTAWLASIENQNSARTRKRWNMFLWMISYNF